MFGTDYPNSYGVATISEEVGLAARIYKYMNRAGDQPSLA